MNCLFKISDCLCLIFDGWFKLLNFLGILRAWWSSSHWAWFWNLFSCLTHLLFESWLSINCGLFYTHAIWIKVLHHWVNICASSPVLVWMCFFTSFTSWIQISLEVSTLSWEFERNPLSLFLSNPESSLKLALHKVNTLLWHEVNVELVFFSSILI